MLHLTSVETSPPPAAAPKEAPAPALLPVRSTALRIVLALVVAGLVAWGVSISIVYGTGSRAPAPAPPAPSAAPPPPFALDGIAMDVTVVGGGVGGLYTAWRIEGATAGATDVQVYERTVRFGGRLWSRVIDNACPSVIAEEGGMRLRQGVDKQVLRVAELLGISLVPFNMNDGPPATSPTQDNPTAPLLLRSVRLSRAEFNALTMAAARGRLAYDLSVPDDVCASDMLLSDCLDQMTNELVDGDGPVLEDPCNAAANIPLGPLKNVAGKPHYYWAMSTLATQKGYPRDMLMLSDDVGGYDEVSYLNAAGWPNDDWLTHLNNYTLERYVRPELGMEEIPRALAREFSESRVSRGATPGLHTNRKLTTIEIAPPESGYAYRLIFVSTVTNPCSRLTSYAAEAFEVVYTNRVVLALPRKAILELQLKINTYDVTQAIADLINDVQGIANAAFDMNAMKLQVSWNGPGIPPRFYAQSIGFNAGRAISSEYSSQQFSWYPGTNTRTPLPACANLSSVHVYISGLAREKFWLALSQPRIADAPLCANVTIRATPELLRNAALKGNAADDELDRACQACYPSPEYYYGRSYEGVPVEMADAVYFYICEMLGLPPAEVPRPTAITYQIYDVASTEAAFHLWSADTRWWELSEQSLQPSPDLALHIVGEAFASPSGQGWISGALETSERMLTLKMGLSPLDGLTREDICRFNPFAAEQLPRA